jgi:hypothetical protein
MPIDLEIRRLAQDPDAIATIEMIDLFFAGLAERVGEQRGVEPGLVTAEEIIEYGWRMMKRGIVRLHDREVDDEDDPLIQEAVTPGQRVRARRMGAKLFAVRQHLRRAARKRQEGRAPLPARADAPDILQ